MIPSTIPTLLNLDKEYSSKECFFWSNSYEIEDIKTSIIYMLHARITKLWSHDQTDNTAWVS